ELCQNPRSRNGGRIQPAILPKMNFREITETGIGERREERMAEINFREHGVAAWMPLFHRKMIDREQTREGGGRLGRAKREQERFSRSNLPVQGAGALLREGAGDDQERC